MINSKMKPSEKMNHSTALLISILLAAAIVIIPFTLRLLTNPSYPGDEAYYHIQLVDKIISGKAGLVEGPVTCFDAFLYLLCLVVGSSAAYFTAPLIIGFITLIFYSLILKKMHFNTYESFIMTIFFAFSPIFIYSSFFLSAFSFYVMISLAAFYLMISGKKAGFAIALIIYASMAFSDAFAAGTNAILLLAYMLYSPGIRKKAIAGLSVILASTGIYWTTLLIKNGAPANMLSLNRNIVQGYLTDLGGMTGFGTFALILAAITIYFLWKEKRKHASLFLGLIIIILLSLFSVQVNIFLNIAVSMMAGYAFIRLIDFKWSSNFMKRMVFLTIFVGIFLTTFLYSYSIVFSPPSQDTINGLRELGNYSKGAGNTLALEDKGYIIEYYSGTNAILMQYSNHNADYYSRLHTSDQIFKSSELETTARLLKDLNVTYIYVDDETINKYTFSTQNQGLFYLFRNNETFKSAYEADGVEIYMVRQP